MKRTVLLAVGLIAVLFSIVTAAVPQLINFQGILRDGSGNPVADGSYSVQFTIYDAPSAGNIKWQETQSVSTVNGLFSVLLGSLTPVLDSVFNDSSRYLGIKVGADPEMTPRQKLASVGFSQRSSEWTSAGSDLFRLNGFVGLGALPSPGSKLYVETGGSAGLQIGVQSYSNASTSFLSAGIFGTSNNASTGNAYGGYFSASSPSGLSYGVYGNGDTYGAYGFSDTYGVVGEGGTRGVTGIGSFGVYGQGATIGAYGIGFYGVNGEGYYGVLGSSNDDGGYGIFGYNEGNPATWAGWFSGDVKVTGGLNVDGFIFKNGGGFKIDHPTDPANKYLYHSFVESPDMTNLYNGNITLDGNGEATVELPDWFGAVNRDFRYQLTAIGAPGPNLYVAKKVSNNQFKIAGGTAGMEVSWQVTGIRKDAYAEAHRIPVEEVKTGKEKGKYLHPEEHGAPASLGMHYEEQQKMAAEREKMKEEQAKMETERKKMEEQRVKMEQERAKQIED